MDPREFGPPAQTMKSARCSASFWYVTPTVTFLLVEGHIEAPYADWLQSASLKSYAQGRPVDTFTDASRVTGYDTSERLKVTENLRAHLKSVHSAHILVSSKLLAMGISVANLVTGGIMQTYASPARFEATLRNAIAASPKA